MNDTITTSEASRKAENTNEIWTPVLTILTEANTSRDYNFGTGEKRISFEVRIDDEGYATRDYQCREYSAAGEVLASHFVMDKAFTGRAAIHFIGFVGIRTEDKLRITRVEIDRATSAFSKGGKTEQVHLAGRYAATELDAGEWFTLAINQGQREAEVLATIGDEALVEYTMPAGTSALHIMNRKTSRGEKKAHGGGTSISYSKLPVRWIEAATEQAGVWVANPQSGDRYPENIAEALAFRAEKKAKVKAHKAEIVERRAAYLAKLEQEEKDLAEKNAADAAACEAALAEITTKSAEELVEDMGRALFPQFTYILHNEKRMLALAAGVSYMIADEVDKYDRAIGQQEIVEMWREKFAYLLED